MRSDSIGRQHWKQPCRPILPVPRWCGYSQNTRQSPRWLVHFKPNCGDSAMNHKLLGVILYLGLVPAALAVEVKIEFQGLDSDQQKNVLLFLSLEQERQRPGLDGSRVRYLHQQAPDQIREALKPFGLFRPKIEADLEQQADQFIARYRVEPGTPVKLRSVNFQVMGEGQKDPLFAPGLPFKVGDPLDQQAYDAAKSNFLSRAVEEGYLDAKYSEAEIQVDPDQDAASIRLTLETGRLYRVGELRWRQKVMDPAFLARYPDFKPGERYSQEKLTGLQSRLADSEYFSQVEVRPLRQEAEGDQVPIDILLEPNLPNLFRYGLGFTTDAGPRVSMDWQRRRIGDQGHNALLELSLSPAQSILKYEYKVPLERPYLDTLSYVASAEHADTDTRVGNRVSLGLSAAQGLVTDWRRTLGLDYVYEDMQTADDPGTNYHLIPSAGWTHMASDGKSFILRGHRLSYQVLGAAEPVLSSSSFLQARVKTKSIFGLGEEWRLLGRMELGTSLSGQLDDVPVSKRFYAGGDNSIRGFALDTLGPRDDSGEVIGGRHLAVGSLELEHRLDSHWSVAAFYDAGNAFDQDYTNDLAQGIGLGVRWQSPVGPIRLDLAGGSSSEENSWRIHFIIGPDL